MGWLVSMPCQHGWDHVAMARETAPFQGSAIDALSLRRLLRALEEIFVAVAVLSTAGMMAGSSFIANRWLKVQQLPLEEVKNAVMLSRQV